MFGSSLKISSSHRSGASCGSRHDRPHPGDHPAQDGGGSETGSTASARATRNSPQSPPLIRRAPVFREALKAARFDWKTFSTNNAVPIIEEEGKDVAVEKMEFVGTTLEVEPAIGHDGFAIHLSVAVDKTFGEPEIVKGTMLAPVSGKQVTVERINIDQDSIRTQTKLFSGQTRLLGTLHPSRGDSSETYVVFLKAWIRSLTA